MPTYKNNAVIWTNTDKNGRTYLSFKAERDIKKGESFNFFKNNKGGNESRPDYKSYEKIQDSSSEDKFEKNMQKNINDNDLPF